MTPATTTAAPFSASAAITMLIGSQLLFSVDYTISRFMLTHGLDTFAFATLRLIAPAIVLGLAMLRGRRHPRTTIGAGERRWPILATASVALAINQLTYGEALANGSAASSALIVGSLPVVAGLLAWVAGIDRPLPRRFWAAAGVGVLGVTLIAASARPHAGGGPPGELFAVGSVLSWAVYSVAAVPLIRWYGWLRAMAAAMALGAVPLCIAAILRPSGGVGTFGVEVGTALTFSLAGVVAAQVLWMQGIARVGPARAAVFTNLQPLLGALFAVLLLSEVLRWTHMIGGALILLALMLNPVRAGPEGHRPSSA